LDLAVSSFSSLATTAGACDDSDFDRDDDDEEDEADEDDSLINKERGFARAREGEYDL
jgi:hypothetical protein